MVSINGSTRNVSIVLEGGKGTTTARGAMIDGLNVVETLAYGTGTVYGIAGDTSATLKVELLGLPAGAVLSDGVRSILV